MLRLPSSTCRRGQWSLIGSLVAVAILILLAALYLPKMIGRTAGPSGGQDAAIQKAYGVACSMYQSQMDQAASMYRSDHNGEPPTSMDDLKKYGVTDDMINSPGCSFQIGPGGRVVSANPGTPMGVPGPGQPAAQGYGQPGAGGQPGDGRRHGAGEGGGQPGPGGITIPNIPGSGDAGQ